MQPVRCVSEAPALFLYCSLALCDSLQLRSWGRSSWTRQQQELLSLGKLTTGYDTTVSLLLSLTHLITYSSPLSISRLPAYGTVINSLLGIRLIQFQSDLFVNNTPYNIDLLGGRPLSIRAPLLDKFVQDFAHSVVSRFVTLRIV